LPPVAQAASGVTRARTRAAATGRLEMRSMGGFLAEGLAKAKRDRSRWSLERMNAGLMVRR
jgi:hypothetical protein